MTRSWTNRRWARIGRRGVLGRRSRAALLAVLAPVAPLAGAADAPPTISPGARTSTAISDRCPTFSWGSVPDARGYELRVFEVTVLEAEPQEVLRTRIPGAALSWTPDLERCFERGLRYAWTVRTIGVDESNAWSPAALFEIAAQPGDDELAEAFRLVREYFAMAGGERSPRTEPAAVPEAATEHAVESPGEDDEASTEPAAPMAPPSTQMSVDGNVNAVSFSGSGAMLTGLEPANLSAGTAAIDISGNAATATEATHAAGASDLVCTNCVGAAEIDRTGLDADLLDGLDSSVFAPTAHGHFGEVWSGTTDNGLQVDSSTPDGGKFALWGRMTAASGGLFSAAVRGENLSQGEGLGVWGSHAGNGIGVLGTSQNGVGVFGQSTSPAGHAGFFDGQTYVSSRLGIGNVSPAWPLSIAAPQAVAQLWSSADVNGSVVELKSSVLNATYLGAINFNNAADTYPGQIAYGLGNAMTFRTNGAERVRINSSGRLGIGTTDPQAELHVNGRARFESEVGIAGAVGIGTMSPSAMLDVNGSIAIAPTQRWVSIAATAFHFKQGALSDHNSTSRTARYSALNHWGISPNHQYAHGPGYAPVSFPDGARLRELKGKRDPATAWYLRLHRVRLDTEGLDTEEVELIAEIQGPGDWDIATTTAIAPGTEVVDNSTYAYVLETAMYAAFGVRIRYEITSPLP